MARPRPIGFGNFRTFSFVSNDGSGFTFFRKASFSKEVGSHHKLYEGPSIQSISAHASAPVVTTSEDHGFVVGQTVTIHGVPGATGVLLNGERVVATVQTTSPYNFTLVGIFDTSATGGSPNATGAVGIAGVDIEARIPVANYACVPGGLCEAEYPAAWETPLVG